MKKSNRRAFLAQTWKKMYGKGRIFYTSVGHNLNHIAEMPEAMEMLKRGIKWASASKYATEERWLTPVYGNKLMAMLVLPKSRRGEICCLS